MNKIDQTISIKKYISLENNSIRKRAAQKRCKKWGLKMVYGNGGRQYRIPISLLSPEAQKRYFASIAEKETSRELLGDHLPDDIENECRTVFRAPDYNLHKPNKYLIFCNGEKSHLTGNALKADLNQSEKAPSYSSILRARRAYEIMGFQGLISHYGNRAGKTKVSDELFNIFHGYWMREGAPSAHSCWLRTIGHFPDIPQDSFPSPTAFIRRMRSIPERSQYLARYGEAAHNRKYASYINRNYDNIRCGQVWVSDHHQLDVCCIDPITKKPCYPWATVWIDFKSTKWLGWLLHCESPNASHIFESFHTAGKKWGLCDDIIIDNGKDYRCRDFAGRPSRIKLSFSEGENSKQITTLRLLKINVHFALPYNAQSKNIERSFGTVIDLFCKHQIGYRGSNVVERPEKLAKEISGGSILSFEKLSELFDDFVINCLNKNVSRGKNLNGKSPDQLWAKEFTVKREISQEALALFCMRTSEVRTIGRNGFYDPELGTHYWSEEMSGCKGTKVFARRANKDYAEAYIFNARNGEFMFCARMDAFSSPALAKTEVEHAELKAALATKKRDMRIAKAYAKTNISVDPIMGLRDLKMGISMTSGTPDEASPKIHLIPNTAMDDVIKKRKELERRAQGDDTSFIIDKSKKKILFDSSADRDASYGIETPVFSSQSERDDYYLHGRLPDEKKAVG